MVILLPFDGRKLCLLTANKSAYRIPKEKHIWCQEREWHKSIHAVKGAVQKETGSPNYFKFTREFKSAKI